MADEIFVGREKEREDIKAFVAEKPKGIVILDGHTDTGKSAIIEKLASEIRDIGYAASFAQAEWMEESPLPFLNAVKQIVEQFGDYTLEGGMFDKVMGVLNTEMHMWKFGKAGIKDLADKAGLKAVHEEFSSQLNDKSTFADLDRLIAEQKATSNKRFKTILEEISHNSGGRKCVLCIDQAEDGAEPFWDFLVYVCNRQNLPEGIFVIFSLNPDKNSYDWINRKYIAELKYQEHLPLPIGGLNEEDLGIFLKQRTGVTFNKGDIKSIREQSDGRPLLLIEWLNTGEYKAGKIKISTDRFKSFIDKRIKDLKPEARLLVKLLSILPRRLSGLDAYRQILCMEMNTCDMAMDELLSKGVFREYRSELGEAGKYKWFTHGLYQKHIFEGLDRDVLKDLAGKSIEYIGNNMPDGEDLTLLARLLALTDDYEKAFKLNAMLSNHAYKTSNYALCLEAATACLDISEKTSDKKQRSHALGLIGLVYLAWGELDEALELYEECLKINREIGDRADEAVILNNISQAYNARGDYDKALEYLEESRKISREIGNRSGDGATLNNMAAIAHTQGDDDIALSYLEESLKIRRETGDRAGEGRTLNNISQIYKARGDYETALRYLEESLPIRCEVGDRAGEAKTLNNLATIAQTNGDYGTSLRYLENSLQISREIGDRAGEDVALHNIAGIALAKKDLLLALNYIEEALKIQRDIGNRYGQRMSLYRKAGIFIKLQEIAESIKIMEQVIELDEDLGLPHLEKDKATLEKLKRKLK